MLAHLVFRNLDGSFTASGWYCLVISGFVLLGSITYAIAPAIAFRVLAWQVRRIKGKNSFISSEKVETWQASERARWILRIASLGLACLAVWFVSLAITAGPGQLV